MRLILFGEDPRIARGGIPRYLLPLASELAQRGCKVHYLFSGAYTAQYDWTFRRRWRVSARDGFTVHELRNPASVGIHGGAPELDVDNDDAACIEQRVAELTPDLIHIHSLVGVPVRALAGLSRIAPVVLSVHDYSLICQRRVLVQRNESLCRTYPSQEDCSWCAAQTNRRRYVLQARLRNTPNEVGIKIVHATEKIMRHDLVVNNPGADQSESSSNAQAGPFRRRLNESVRLVNEHVADVLAVSQGVRDILLRVGIDGDRLQIMHIGSASAERLERMALPCESGQPVTFMFLGGLIPTKGSHVLVEALRTMSKPPRVIIAGGGHESYVQDLRDRAPDGVEFRPAFTSEQQPALLAQADVVLAPSVGPDPGPQIVLEALAAGRPVIGSNVGGIPDFVQDGINGRIFQSENAVELAEVLAELDDPKRVSELARNAHLPTTVEQHVEQILALYRDRLGKSGDADPDEASSREVRGPSDTISLGNHDQ